MKRKFGWFVFFTALFFTGDILAGSPSVLSITGLVKQPLNLTVDDLERHRSIEVQLNEVMEDSGYHGVFYYSGVPLKTLLEFASIEKGETAFSKKVDLAVLVRNREGKQVVLSWGEVFYRNPGRIIVAASAIPIMPRHDCKTCHSPEVYKSRLVQLHRKIGFPKLVVSSDSYADRSLEGITSIEVLDLCPKMPAKRLKKLFAPEFSITDVVRRTLVFKDLSSYPRRAMKIKHLGEGKGYHGIEKVEGAYLRNIIDKAGIAPDLCKIFLVSAPDGYRALFSYGEIFLDPAGERMIIADRLNGKPIEKGGKFVLVAPGDLMADRHVKSIRRIEVISVRQDPKL
ncbi:MAG: hypothetical protein B1H11_09135 [Desulfobacteraceae bacterium 4484_190.1]|nr:MAG: hypothetical protein B1H11_09135 [Desulfobacteraceae bacterium 4484_190.1]